MNSISEIRTGVIGVGSMGLNHARIYKRESNLIGLSDLDTELGQKVAQEFDVEYFESCNDLLRQVDAVSVAVPTSLHGQIASKVIERGVHLLVEKPIASNLREARKIILDSEKAGVTLSVGHIERHNPAITHVKNSIASGEWGNLITMSSKRLSNYPERIHDVGVVIDLAIHDIDIMNYLASSAVRNAKSMVDSRVNEKFEDCAVIMLEYENGVKGICETNWLTPVKIRELTLTFDKAFVVVDYIKQTLTVTTRSSYSVNPSNLFMSSEEIEKILIKPKKQEPLKLEIMDFLESIKNKRKPLVTGEDGFRALEIALRVL